jgi:Prenyltransferase and squalene oxidase repeat
MAVILSLQKPSGIFAGDAFGETDTRFLYCAVNALSLLGRLDEMNKDKAVEYIERCRNYDGGFGSSVGAESHSAQGTLSPQLQSCVIHLTTMHSFCLCGCSCHPGPIRRGRCRHSSLVVIGTTAT